MMRHFSIKLSFKPLTLLVALLALLALVSIINSPKANAAYQHGRLIDDSVFLDAKAMNATDVQNFLVGKNAGLKDMKFVLSCYGSDSTERQLYTAAGAKCDTPIPASEIIYYAAQVYGVNPRVILATMQKEQSLTTAPNPTSWQLSQAMGYACPTSGSCSSSSNFSYQIDSGTWVLRYHFERARGNMSWWRPSTSWTCGTAKPSYYTPNLYPNQNVNFVDPYSGIQYATVYIENAATSAFYCYTPHVFNNHHNSPHPNDPKGSSKCYSSHPLSGDKGRCYTGSYNFVYFFELWFGSTIGPEFAAQLHSKSPYQVVNSGQGKSVYLQYKNIGRAFWKDDASTFPGYRPVHVATGNPINRSSSFRANNWLSPSRTTGTISKVYEADGSTLASDQHTVKPGQVARFEFTIHASTTIAGGVYREYFQPILEGAPDYTWNMGGVSYIDIGVHVPTYKASYHSQSSYPIISPDFSHRAFLQFKNTGNTKWYDNASVPVGEYPVHLATSWPINRSSKFADGWPSSARPNFTFTKVYESDGTTLAANQHIVLPGQIARFEFSMKNYGNVPEGFYPEHFQPIREGAPNYSWNLGASAWLNVGIPETINKASFHSQSNYPTLQRGGSSSGVFIQFKNSGNTKWYDNTSVTQGKYPVHLATSWPINRGSKFADGWANAARPNLTFSKVYESNGTTLAANQHIVLPGQIARFEFSMKAPLNQTVGFHKEYFEPILEGAPDYSWNMNAVAWLGVNVQ